jgi:4'-phosphopantetheinyl transferase EntD
VLWLHRQPRFARAEAATILFGAKEAFYKYQYSLTRTWLDFKDVTVSVTPDRFYVTAAGKQGFVELRGWVGTSGRYLREENWMLRDRRPQARLAA